MKKSITSKRISAYLIDILFLFTLISLITEIKFINPHYDKYEAAFERYNEVAEKYIDKEIDEEEFTKQYNEVYYQINKYSISYNIVIIFSIILYFSFFQKYNNGQTLGKKLMRLKVVDNETLENPSLLKYLIRVLPTYFIYIGGFLPLIINNILLFILNYSYYMTITIFVSYAFLILSIVSFVMIIKRQDERGIHDMLAKTKVIYIEK